MFSNFADAVGLSLVTTLLVLNVMAPTVIFGALLTTTIVNLTGDSFMPLSDVFL